MLITNVVTGRFVANYHHIIITIMLVATTTTTTHRIHQWVRTLVIHDRNASLAHCDTRATMLLPTSHRTWIKTQELCVSQQPVHTTRLKTTWPTQ